MEEKEHEKELLPLISVVVAAYNSARTIERCLRAIKDQEYSHLEIIVVDALNYNPVEQKKCREIIERYGKYFQDGPERSIQRNRGIAEAHGEFVLILDQDMYLTPAAIRECYELLSTSKNVACCIPEISIGPGFWTRCVALDRYICGVLEREANECCRFLRKKDAQVVGGYDPLIVGAEDADFHYKISQIGPIGKIRAIALHDEGETKFWKRVQKKYYYSGAFRSYLRRRPAAATKQYSPFKLAYLKHFKILLRQPFVATGMFVLRFMEITAGITGILFNNRAHGR